MGFKGHSIKHELITEGHLDFLQEMHELGVDLTPEELKMLERAKRITFGDTDMEILAQKQEDKKDFQENLYEGRKLPNEQAADEHVMVIDNSEYAKVVGEEKANFAFAHTTLLNDSKTYEELQDKSLFTFRGDGSEITKKDWYPESNIEHKPEFVAWINSVNSGFQNMIQYQPFRRYCQQAKTWLDEGGDSSQFYTKEERNDYRYNEFKRCRENTLYFLDKYLTLKDGDLTSGNNKYKSKPAHKVICFLMDCGYSLMVGKGRQMAATSTFAGTALAKIIFRSGFTMKLIAQDDMKAKEIVNDKVKFRFNNLPEWMKPTVGNDREEVLRFVKKGVKKGSKEGADSILRVVPPSVGAINGGSPDCVYIDEAGYIGMLGKMIKEARPTMFGQDPYNGKLKMKRQIVIWGTGGTEEGEVKRKTKSYEVEYYNCVKHWEEKDFHYGIIPLFFDWTARPGMTKEMYLKEKRAYAKEDGPEKDASLIQFKQHYPSTIQDMFLSTGKLLVSADWINQQMDRIRTAPHKLKSQKGYFEPVFDYTQPKGEYSDVPYKIIGATFVPLNPSMDEMSRATVEIFLSPSKTWRNRYFQGTDPIMNDTGYSDMASVIYDSHFNTLSAVMSYRDSDHKYNFLQTLLLGLYYDTNNKGLGTPELVEANIGTAYIDYKEEKGYFNSLVHNKELPDYLTGGGSMVGIDNRGNRSRFIINKMAELITTSGNKFYILDFFRQLETFHCTVTQKGAEVWGVSDKRQFKDDILYATVFAYICRMTFDRNQPYEVTSEKMTYKVTQKLVRNKDNSLSKVPVRVPVRH